ncbi:MAG: hypothetical protein Q7T74_01025 [Candidatus Saccharibacteria bacterium]|nr:hypothetical protein [Candidatus Saccharibacteria bacterium]
MELVKSAGKKTSLVSEVLYIGFNASLATGVLLLVLFGLPTLAFLLVIISKWRVFAVRPRFWWANIKANLLDLLLGLSAVTMMLQASNVVWLQVIIALLYALWLIVLKPRSDRRSILIQAGVAQFMAITALYSVSFDWPAILVVACMWLVGYISAQHAISSYEDSDVTLLSLAWGLIVAELGWLAYSWTIAYSVAPAGIFKIPSIAFIVTLLAYFAAQAYRQYAIKGKLRLNDVTIPAIFSGSIILIIIIFFNDISRG